MSARRLATVIFVITWASAAGLTAACSGSPGAPEDGGTDTMADGPTPDAASDASVDGGDRPDGAHAQGDAGGDSSPEAADAAPDANPDAEPDALADAEPDAGLDADATSDVAAFDAGDGGPLGVLFFWNYINPPQPTTSSFSGDFYQPGPADAQCTISQMAGCIITQCQGGDGGVDGGPTWFGAGDVTIAGGELPDGGVTLQQAQDGYLYDPASLFFGDGDSLTVAASGGAVPAFGPVTLVAPGAITLTAPVPNGQGTFVVPTAQDLSVTWTGGEPGAQVSFEVLASAGNTLAVANCTWDASNAMATIPSAALAPFAGMSGGVFYGQQRATSFSAGSFPVQFVVQQSAFGDIEFQ